MNVFFFYIIFYLFFTITRDVETSVSDVQVRSESDGEQLRASIEMHTTRKSFVNTTTRKSRPTNKTIRNSNYVGERKVCVCVCDDDVHYFRIARKLRGVINNPFTLTFFSSFFFTPNGRHIFTRNAVQ